MGTVKVFVILVYFAVISLVRKEVSCDVHELHLENDITTVPSFIYDSIDNLGETKSDSAESGPEKISILNIDSNGVGNEVSEFSSSNIPNQLNNIAYNEKVYGYHYEKPDIPFESGSVIEETVEKFNGYDYPKPEIPITYPPPTTEESFPEASARIFAS